MSDPRGSGFDPYAYLHDTDEHTTSYLPPEQEAPTETSATPAPSAQPVAPAPRVEPAAPVAPTGLTGPAESTGPAKPTGPDLDIESDLPPTMTRRQLREARERAARQRQDPAEQARATTSTPSISAAALVAGQSTPQTEAQAQATQVIGTVSVPATAAPATSPTQAAPVQSSTSPAPYASPDAWSSGPSAPGPGEPPPDQGRSRRTVLLVLLGLVVAIAALAALVIFVVMPLLRGDSQAAPSGPPTASGQTEGRTSPLLDLLPTTVTGGEFALPTGEPTPEATGEAESTEEPSEGAAPGATTYTLVQDGYVDNPQTPEGALESVVGQFSGGAELVTLTASRFGTSEEALAAATAKAGTLGPVVEEGVVFPDDNLGYYWIFNTDGLVTIVWTDGDLGFYWIVSEDAQSALELYQGLEF